MFFAVGLPVGSDGAADPSRKGASPLGSARERPPRRGARLSGAQRHGASHYDHDRPGNLLGFDRRFGGRGACGLRRRRYHHPPRAGPGRLDGRLHSPRGRLCKPGTPGQRGMRTSTGLLLCGLLLASFVSTSLAHASEERMMGNTVVEEGQTVEKVSTVWGDIRVEGEVEQDVNSAFGDVEIYGPVGGDVDAGFGDVYIDAPVGGDVDVGHGDVQLGSGARVGEKISLGNGSFYPHQEAVFGNVETAR